ncbi:YrzI family small protein [Sporolactobacillus terrae]|uniref:YrzI family small protein n=3 Tax=Sporolactobacillus terrae TaxID=269673 RepID=A0ABX5Q8Q2_9BACL|nr:YrzI family small protein [Sporolactobacillus terrae]QAA25967.1 YrzI family small protein [Sporolactobacillus terrae]
MMHASAELQLPMEQREFFHDPHLLRRGGKKMVKFNLFALTFTVSIRKTKSAHERYEDRKRIKAIHEKMLDKRFEYERYIR